MAQVSKIPVDQGHLFQAVRQSGFGGVQGRRIPVDADEPPGRQPPGDLPGMARATQRSIQIGPLRADVQPLQALSEEDRLVDEFHRRASYIPRESIRAAIFSGVISSSSEFQRAALQISARLCTPMMTTSFPRSAYVRRR